MLGDVIGAKAGAVVLLDEFQTSLKQIRERYAVVVKMIENAELQFESSLPGTTVFVERAAHT